MIRNCKLPHLWLFRFAFIVACLGVTSSSFAHPFHLCVGQMRWNTSGKVWEVSLRVHPQDLEKAMSTELTKVQSNQSVSIDDDGFSELASRYLETHFFVRRSALALKKEELSAILRLQKASAWASLAIDRTKENSTSEDSSHLKWIGMEQERGWLWIHLELIPPKVESERQKLWLVNRILLDSVERQENTVTIDPVELPKFSLQFRAGEEFQEMKPKK